MPRKYETGEISKKRRRHKFNSHVHAEYSGEEALPGLCKEANNLVASSIVSFEVLSEHLRQQSLKTLSAAGVGADAIARPGAIIDNYRPRLKDNKVARSPIGNKVGVEHNSEAGFAIEILHRLDVLATRLAEERFSLALLEVFQLGMAERERQLQEWADAGWGVRSGGKKGHDIAYSETPEDHAKMEKRFDDLREGGMRKEAAYRAVAHSEGLNWESVARVIRERKKRHTS